MGVIQSAQRRCLSQAAPPLQIKCSEVLTNMYIAMKLRWYQRQTDAAINRAEEHSDRLVSPDAKLVPFEDVGVGLWFICCF